ncbi:E3 ubiquitin-protein ligase SHPRH, partial [Stegodyphus mimosarum]
MPPRKKARQVADIMLPVKSTELAKILEAGIDYPLTINVNFSGLHASEFKLGDFAVTIQGTLYDLVCEDPIYLYFRRFSLFCMLVWNEYDDNLVLREKFAYATCDVPREVLLNLLDEKAFCIVLNPANVQLASSTLILEVYLTDNVFLSLKSPSEILFSRSVKNVNGAVKHFKNVEYVDLEDRLCPKQSMLKILDNIQNSFDPKNELQIFSQYLIPRLRHYQSQAVHWMLRQEEVRVHTKNHPLYTQLELKENTKIYYQKYGGFFVKEEYTAGKPLGGILADEMG